MSAPFPAPEELLPHRPPMLLLRAVLSHRVEETCCEGWLDEGFARACGGEVSGAFGLELIAQTAAVHHALRARAAGENGASPAARGLLLGSRRLELARRSLPVEEGLTIRIFDGGQPPGAGAMIRFEGQVEDAAGQIIARGDATVLEWRPDIQVA